MILLSVLSRIWIAVFCMLFYFQNAQNVIVCVVVDAKTRKPIEYVYVSSNNSKLIQVSNKAGKISLNNDGTITAFSFYKTGYARQTIALNKLLAMDSIFMEPIAYPLEEVTVSNGKPVAIIKDKRFYVDDYMVLPNSDILAVLSAINTKRREVVCYKKGRGIVFKQIIEGEGDVTLFKDAFENIHAVSSVFSRQIEFNSDSTFYFFKPLSKSVFNSTLFVCALNMDTALLFKSTLPPVNVKMFFFDVKKESPVLSYIKQSKYGKSVFFTVSYNNGLKEMYDNELNDQLQIKRSIDEMGWKGIISEQQAQSKITMFYKQVLSPIYAPVFLINDSICIFNFPEKEIVFLHPEGRVLKKVEMNKDDFSVFREFELLHDKITGQFYYKTREGSQTVLGTIDIYHGKITSKLVLHKAFPKNIKVVNKRIYYQVREKQWDDTDYLYEQGF